MATQLQAACRGRITDEIKFVADKEKLDAQLVCDELAAGRLVIPANKLHLAAGNRGPANLKPIGIGRALTTKINANIGTSSARTPQTPSLAFGVPVPRSSIDEELEKIRTALEAGADTVMDLSTGGDLVK